MLGVLCLLPFGCTTFVCLPKIRHGEGGEVYVNVSRFGVSEGKKTVCVGVFRIEWPRCKYLCTCVCLWLCGFFMCVCVWGGEVSALLGFVQVKSPLISCLNALSTKAFG